MFRSLCLAMTFLLSGCGYTTGSLLPSNYKQIYIEPFKNRIGYLNENVRGLYIPLLEVKAHDATVVRFQQDGHLKIAHGPGGADLVLKGELLSFDRDDITLSDNQNVEQYRIRITVALVMVDTATNTEMWSEGSFSGEGTYYTSGPSARSESAALQDALTDLSRRIVERTLEDW